MWPAITALVALLSAGITYWLKRAADNPPEVRVKLENALTKALESVRLKDQHIRRLRALNRKYRSELVNERRKVLKNLSAADAAELLGGGLRGSTSDGSDDDPSN